MNLFLIVVMVKDLKIGNIMKYIQRYGKKGTREDARKDLLKVLSNME